MNKIHWINRFAFSDDPKSPLCIHHCIKIRAVFLIKTRGLCIDVLLDKDKEISAGEPFYICGKQDRKGISKEIGIQGEVKGFSRNQTLFSEPSPTENCTILLGNDIHKDNIKPDMLICFPNIKEGWME